MNTDQPAAIYVVWSSGLLMAAVGDMWGRWRETSWYGDYCGILKQKNHSVETQIFIIGQIVLSCHTALSFPEKLCIPNQL